MSRLDALTARFEGNSDRARAFTRAVRAQFVAAPSYAQILRALKEVPGKNPSPEHVAAIIKRDLGERPAPPGARLPRPGRPTPSGGRPTRRPSGARPAGRPRTGSGNRRGGKARGG
jgi:hypothetical protein